MKLMSCRICGLTFEPHHSRDHICPQCEADADEADMTTTRARPNPALPPEPAQDKGEEEP